MALKNITMLFLLLGLCSGCVFIIPAPRHEMIPNPESRSGIAAKYAKKMIKKEFHLKDVIMLAGTPHLINHEQREVIYHSQQFSVDHADFVIFIFIFPFPIAGPSSYHHSDLYYQLRFDSEWTLVGIRQYRLNRSQCVSFSDDLFTDYSFFMHDYFVDYQYHTGDNPWPPLKQERPHWDHHLRGIKEPISYTKSELLALPELKTDAAEDKMTKNNKGRRKQ